MFRVCIVLCFFLVLPGCKLLLIVTNGGTVDASVSGTSCAALTNCEFEIVDATYTESFQANPDQGFQFVQWYDAPNFMCPGSTDPVCAVTSAVLAGIVSDADIDDASNIYLMAVFSDKAPIQATIAGPDGREWAQPALFTDLSWNDIEAVCPFGNAGICTGSLNGWDMNGWIWGNTNDVTALLNAYGAEPPIGFPSVFGPLCDVPWVNAFIADNWLSTASVSPADIVNLFATFAEIPDSTTGRIPILRLSAEEDSACPGKTLSTFSITKNLSFQADTATNFIGALFYRSP